MANTLKAEQSNVFVGLGTATFTVAIAGLYVLSVQSFLPYQASGSSNNSSVTTGGSSLQFVINQNGTPKLTQGSPSPTQPIMNGSVKLNCAVNDVLTVVFTSASAADNALNAVKSLINLYSGPGT